VHDHMRGAAAAQRVPRDHRVRWYI
jgi:hypothetical protein